MLKYIVVIQKDRSSLLAQPHIVAMRERQVDLEKFNRDAAYAEANMHDALRNGIYPIEGSESAIDTHHSEVDKFIKLRKSLGTMTERFNASMDPQFPPITVVEIGASNNPACEKETQRLKLEYSELMEDLTERGIAKPEFPRESAMANIAINYHNQDGNYWILSRTRLLTSNEPGTVSFALGKRMTFAMLTGVVQATHARVNNEFEIDPVYTAEDGTLTKKEPRKMVREIIESQIDSASPTIIPIRTTYTRLRDATN